MVKTGSGILFIFSLAALLLPLFPLGMLLLRKTFHQQKTAPLIALCVIAFFKEALLLTITSSPANPVFINAVFDLAEMIVLLLLYRTEIRRAQLRQGLGILLTAIISVALTIYSLEGITAYAGRIEVFLSGFILLASLMVIAKITANEKIFNLRSVVFWIASGTFCYYAMFLLSEGLKNYEPLSKNTDTQRFILLTSVYMMRYVFYIVAAYVSRESREEEIVFH